MSTADGDNEDLMFDPSLFASNPVYELMNFEFGDIKVTLKSQELGNQHIELSTGLLLWPAARVLSEFIALSAHLFKEQKVLELGSGVGLCGVVVSKICKAAVLTDNEEKTLQLLNQNIDLNDFSRAPKISKFKSEHGESFDVIIGSDLIYQSVTVEPLFFTVDSLLSSSPSAFFVLSYCDRKNHTPHVLEVAQTYGFESTKNEAEVSKQLISEILPSPSSA